MRIEEEGCNTVCLSLLLGNNALCCKAELAATRERTTPIPLLTADKGLHAACLFAYMTQYLCHDSMLWEGHRGIFGLMGQCTRRICALVSAGQTGPQIFQNSRRGLETTPVIGWENCSGPLGGGTEHPSGAVCGRGPRSGPLSCRIVGKQRRQSVQQDDRSGEWNGVRLLRTFCAFAGIQATDQNRTAVALVSAAVSAGNGNTKARQDSVNQGANLSSCD